MRRFVTLIGAVILLGGVVGAWVQAQEKEPPLPLSAPGTFQAPTARALNAADDEAANEEETTAVEGAVRLSSGTAPVSSRRRAGLAGRLQALRKGDEAESATGSSSDSVRAPATASMSDEVDDSQPAEVIGALPSVLKRPRTRPTTVVPVDDADEPVLTSPSDDSVSTPVAPKTVSPVRPAASTTTRTGSTSPTSAATPTSTITRPSQRPQTLISGSNPSLAIEAAGPKSMTIGKEATYVVTVTNQGVTEAQEVYIAVNLPDHVELADVSGTAGDANAMGEGSGQRLVWKIDSIAGRGQEKLTLLLVPQVAQPVDLQMEWTQAPPMASTNISVLEPKLTMALKGPKDVQYGDTAVYQIIVANPGTGDAEDVIVDLVSEDAQASEGKKLGTITAGQQKVIEVSMTASQAGPMKMHFVARSGDLSAEAVEEVIVRRANLQLEVQGPPLVFAGAEATYTVTLTNVGDAPAESVQLGTVLPDGAEYLGGISGVNPKGSQLVWSAGTLAAGASASFEFTCLMHNAGTYELLLQSKAGDLLTSATTTTKVEAVADLKLTVNDPLGPKPVGEPVIYEVTITNRGTKAARNVSVVVNFSEGIEPVATEGGRAEISDGQAIFSPIASIEPGAEQKLKVKAQATVSGSHIFRAEVRCSDPETRLASEQTTRFFGSGTASSAAAEETTSNRSSGFVPRNR